MRNLLACALLFLAMATARAGGHLSFQVHLPASENDSAVFAQPIRSLSGKNVFIEKTAWLSEHDVKAFYPYKSADGASFGALLRLDDHGQTILDTLSVERRGTLLFVFINGRPLTELQIDKRVSDGKIYLASGLTQQDIQLMAKEWKLLGGHKKK